METAPERSAGRSSGAKRWGAAHGAALIVTTALVGAVLLGATFAGDGSGFDGVLPVGGAAVVLLAVLVVAFAFGVVPLPRLGAPAIGLIAALVLLVVWTGATVVWSIGPDRSWETFNRGLAYVAFLGLGVALAGVGGAVAARVGAALLALVTGAVLVWALAAKVFPSLDPDAERIARLQEPVGYWNALALLADVALVLGLWLGAAEGRRVALRVLGALLAYAAIVVLLLTLSRAGLAAGVGVVLLWLLLSRERVEGGLLLVAAGAPAALVAGWAFTRPALVEEGAAKADRVSDGRVFGVLALVGAALVIALVVLLLRLGLETERRRPAGRVLLAAAGLGAAVCVVAIAIAVGNPVTWFDDEVTGSSCAEVVNDPSRLGSLDPNLRLCWWEEALDVYAHHGIEGAGAGSFEVARKRFRQDARNVVQPHSVPLQHLADGGVVGLGLFVLVVLAGAAVCACALRRLSGMERAAAAALVAAPAAYAVHALVDYNWDFLAVTAPTMVALGALAGAGRESRAGRRRPLLAVGFVVVAVALLVSFTSPRLADRAERSSTRELTAGDVSSARDRALWARVFNPLAVEPFLALARVAERQGRVLRAEREYIRAIELQPENPETWYTAGIFEFEVRDNMCAAYRYLNEAYTRDPVGNQWVDGGPLEVARDAVNAGGCALGS